MAADNKSLGKFQLTGLPPAPRGIPQIDVSFNIDADGILHVTAKDKATSKSSSITIQDSSRLDESEIERMRKEAEEHAEEDKQKSELVEARNQADQLIYSVEKALSDLGEKVDTAKRADIEDRIRRLREKLDKNTEVAEIRREIDELGKASQDIAAEAYKEAQEAAGGAPSDDGDTADNTGEDTDEGDYIDAEYDEK